MDANAPPSAPSSPNSQAAVAATIGLTAPSAFSALASLGGGAPAGSFHQHYMAAAAAAAAAASPYQQFGGLLPYLYTIPVSATNYSGQTYMAWKLKNLMNCVFFNHIWFSSNNAKISPSFSMEFLRIFNSWKKYRLYPNLYSIGVIRVRLGYFSNNSSISKILNYSTWNFKCFQASRHTCRFFLLKSICKILCQFLCCI